MKNELAGEGIWVRNASREEQHIEDRFRRYVVPYLIHVELSFVGRCRRDTKVMLEIQS